jgi:hypothetical protein
VGGSTKSVTFNWQWSIDGKSWSSLPSTPCLGRAARRARQHPSWIAWHTARLVARSPQSCPVQAHQSRATHAVPSHAYTWRWEEQDGGPAYASWGVHEVAEGTKLRKLSQAPRLQAAVGHAVVQPGHGMRGLGGAAQSASVVHLGPHPGSGVETHWPCASHFPPVQPLASHAIVHGAPQSMGPQGEHGAGS